jgi:membrane protein YqaA with SNARE-associated domain
MNSTASLLSLFTSSLLGATLLPGGSEAVLFAVLKAYPDSLWLALFAATLGNTLGGMISFAMGRLFPPTKAIKHVDKVRLYGTPTLLLAWLPIIGDALCLASGWLRLNPWQAALFMAIGKFARYYFVALIAL